MVAEMDHAVAIQMGQQAKQEYPKFGNDFQVLPQAYLTLIDEPGKRIRERKLAPRTSLNKTYSPIATPKLSSHYPQKILITTIKNSSLDCGLPQKIRIKQITYLVTSQRSKS